MCVAAVEGSDDAEANELGAQKRVISTCRWRSRARASCPSGSSLVRYPYKLAWLGCQSVISTLNSNGEPLCMVGDFNIGLKRDLPDPDRQTGGIRKSDAERQALRRPR